MASGAGGWVVLTYFLLVNHVPSWIRQKDQQKTVEVETGFQVLQLLHLSCKSYHEQIQACALFCHVLGGLRSET